MKYSNDVIEHAELIRARYHRILPTGFYDIRNSAECAVMAIEFAYTQKPLYAKRKKFLEQMHEYLKDKYLKEIKL